MNLQEVIEAVHLKNFKTSKTIAVINGSCGSIKAKLLFFKVKL